MVKYDFLHDFFLQYLKVILYVVLVRLSRKCLLSLGCEMLIATYVD